MHNRNLYVDFSGPLSDFLAGNFFFLALVLRDRIFRLIVSLSTKILAENKRILFPVCASDCYSSSEDEI